MEAFKANRRSRFWGLLTHGLLLVVGIVLGRYLIFATTDPPSDPIAIEYQMEFGQSPESISEVDLLALATEDGSGERRRLGRSGWIYFMSPTIQAMYGSTAGLSFGWLNRGDDNRLPVGENPVVLRSSVKDSRIAIEIVVWQGESSFSNHVELAEGETRILRIDDCERIGGPSVFLLIQPSVVQGPGAPVVAPSGGTAAPGSLRSFAPAGPGR